MLLSPFFDVTFVQRLVRFVALVHEEGSLIFFIATPNEATLKDAFSCMRVKRIESSHVPTLLLATPISFVYVLIADIAHIYTLTESPSACCLVSLLRLPVSYSTN